MRKILLGCNILRIKLPSLNPGGVTPPPGDDWILDSGIWNDSGFWYDDHFWID